MGTFDDLLFSENIDRLREALRANPDLANVRDPEWGTPLDRAFMHEASRETILALLEFGADPRGMKGTKPFVGDEAGMTYTPRTPIMHCAVQSGDVALVEALVAHGGLLRDDAYGSLMSSAVYEGIGNGDRRPMVEYLLSQGVPADVQDEYGTTPLLQASGAGRFDLVERLIRAGADESRLRWSLAHWCAVFGGVESEEGLNDLDHADRTPLDLALLRGDLGVARGLVALGARVTNEETFAHAAEGGNADAVSWLFCLDAPRGLQEALERAIWRDRVEVARRLLAAGADPNHNDDPLASARSAGMVRALLEAGADPRRLTHEGRRTLLGWGENGCANLRAVTRSDYHRDRLWRPGTSNPERVGSPFYEAAFRDGPHAYAVRRFFDDDGRSRKDRGRRTVWCADRFGQTLTELPDGRRVLTGGEHEDFYDPDFRIYNDVLVVHPDDSVEIYFYPLADFPPTDFHTATRFGNALYLVGGLGYEEQRDGRCPVLRLDLDTYRITPMETTGDVPPRLYEHRAGNLEGTVVRITGGKFTAAQPSSNEGVYDLDLRTGVWRHVSGPAPKEPPPPVRRGWRRWI